MKIQHNPERVLKSLDELIEKIESGELGENGRVHIGEVNEAIGIFDWFTDTISVGSLRKMLNFVKTARKLGFDGYVCFKVGVPLASHGMWAYEEKSRNGYSPDGDVLYHSFRSGDNYYALKLNGKTEMPLRLWDVKAILKKNGRAA